MFIAIVKQKNNSFIELELFFAGGDSGGSWPSLFLVKNFSKIFYFSFIQYSFKSMIN